MHRHVFGYKNHRPLSITDNKTNDEHLLTRHGEFWQSRPSNKIIKIPKIEVSTKSKKKEKKIN